MPDPTSPYIPQLLAEDRRHFHAGRTTVLGLDPAMTTTGYAVLRGERLVAAGKIATLARDPEPHRLWELVREVVAVIHEYHVDHVAVEAFTSFYTSRQPGTASGVGGAGDEPGRRGRHDRDRANPMSMFLMKSAQTAVQMAALLTGRPLFLYKVSEWKGGQRVGKEAIRERAHLLYRVPTQDHNITDAVMIAHHHVTSGRFRPDRGVVIPAADLLDGLGPVLGALGSLEPAPRPPAHSLVAAPAGVRPGLPVSGQSVSSGTDRGRPGSPAQVASPPTAPGARGRRPRARATP